VLSTVTGADATSEQRICLTPDLQLFRSGIHSLNYTIPNSLKLIDAMVGEMAKAINLNGEAFDTEDQTG
jgi:hypothetical protein